MPTAQIPDLLGVRGANLDGAGPILQFLLVQFVVAAQQHQRWFPVEYVDQGLDLAVGLRPAVELDKVSNRANSGRWKTFGLIRPWVIFNPRDRRCGSLDVGGVVTSRAVRDIVLPGR